MTASASSVLLRLLVPPAALPAEGDDPQPAGTPAATGGISRSLALMQELTRPHAVSLTLRCTELHWPAEPVADLTLVELTDDGDGPALEATGTSALVSWSAVAAGYARRTDAQHFLGSADDAQRILLDEIRTATREAARYFSGEALPIVEVRRGGEGEMHVAFLGVWLADAGDVTQLSGALPSGPWSETAAGTDGTLLVLDQPDAEGHGLRQAVMGLTLMAVVFTSPAHAGLRDLFSSGPTPVVHESEAKVDGTPLVVKSQKLVQTPPKIYPSGLAGKATTGQRRVVVDIKAQRAYLFIDGNLAFETPVSTAAKGRTTPRGTFTITEKVRTGKHSTIYKSPMPYWNRLGETAIGMHTGQLPGYPASHGCIRMPDESARFIFDNAPNGTVVQVVEALPAAPVPAQAAPMMASR